LDQTKQYELALLKYWNPTNIACQQECFQYVPMDKNAEIRDIVAGLGVVIMECPHLQLPLILRSKALAELGLFDQAVKDAQKAHGLNQANKRGLVAEKLTRWRQGMFEVNLHVLANCAISCLDPPFQSGRGVHQRVADAAATLRQELKQIQSSPILDDIPLSHQSLVLQTILSPSDVECHICLQILKDPVTCPCGHTWCRTCIMNSMEQSDSCPMCRVSLPSASYISNRPFDKTIQSILAQYFGSVIDQEPIPIQEKSIPLFVCSLVFPGSKPGFHMFEPRYRAMIKTCMEQNKEFGIVMPLDSQNCQEYGTLVKLTHSEALMNCDIIETEKGPLPRYVVETIGLYRFKIISCQASPLGFSVARIQPIHDQDFEDIPNFQPTLLDSLVEQARKFVSNLLLSVPPTARLHFERKHGKMPQDPSRFSFWLAEFLPMNPYTLYQLLPITNVVDRMQLICNWIGQASMK
jgi:Lon protease-like protein